MSRSNDGSFESKIESTESKIEPVEPKVKSKLLFPLEDFVSEAKLEFIQWIASSPRIRASLYSAAHLKQDIQQIIIESAKIAKFDPMYGDVLHFKKIKFNIIETIYRKDRLKCALTETDRRTHRSLDYYLSKPVMTKELDRYFEKTMPRLTNHYESIISTALSNALKQGLLSLIPYIAKSLAAIINREVKNYDKYSRKIIAIIHDPNATCNVQLKNLDQALNELSTDIVLF
jgi:hypothetical protein